MYSYALLEKGCYYLIQEKENENLTLLQIKAASDYCVFIEKYNESVQQEWKLKTDEFFEIIELLSDDVVKEWANAYYRNEDAYYEGDDE